MLDVLLPRTDAGVLTQFIVVITTFTLTVFWLRRQPEWRIFATGLGVLTLGLMAVRAIH
jgi:hypothetical protein